MPIRPVQLAEGAPVDLTALASDPLTPGSDYTVQVQSENRVLYFEGDGPPDIDADREKTIIMYPRIIYEITVPAGSKSWLWTNGRASKVAIVDA